MAVDYQALGFYGKLREFDVPIDAPTPY